MILFIENLAYGRRIRCTVVRQCDGTPEKNLNCPFKVPTKAIILLDTIVSIAIFLTSGGEHGHGH